MVVEDGPNKAFPIRSIRTTQNSTVPSPRRSPTRRCSPGSKRRTAAFRFKRKSFRAISPACSACGRFDPGEQRRVGDRLGEGTVEFCKTIAYAPLFTRVKTADGRVSIQAQIVSGNFFSVLGVQPALGRAFSSDEDEVPLRDAVAIISREYWTKQFNADPAVIGKTLQLDDPITG